MSREARVTALERQHNPKPVLYNIKGGLPDVLPEGVDIERPGVVEMKVGKKRFFISGGLPDLMGDPRPASPEPDPT